jgi:hypothetical protein
MNTSECYHCQRLGLTRRDFLLAGALSFLGISLSDYIRLGSAQALAATASGLHPPKAQAVILLWLEGGISHVTLEM